MVESYRAVIFEGQGEQGAGMGKSLYKSHRQAREVFDRASEAIGINMATLCFDDPDGQLRRAGYAQPAIVTVSLAQYGVFVDEFGEPGHFAGHSLGEYSAVAASGAISLEDTVKLVKARGELMEDASKKQPGAMAAVLGLTIDKVRDLCKQMGLEIANDNADTQTVIAGLRSRVEDAVKLVNAYRGKFKLLPIDVASHCSLMTSARLGLKPLLDEVDIKDPSVPLVSNVTAEYVMSGEELKSNLLNQLISTVRWRESVKQMINHGAEIFDAFGPGNVLCPLVRRIDSTVDARSFNDSGLSA